MDMGALDVHFQHGGPARSLQAKAVTECSLICDLDYSGVWRRLPP